MAKQKIVFKMVSYGLYSGFDSCSAILPKILKFTYAIPAVLETEFGYILNIKRGKGQKLSYLIEHPKFANSKGDFAPSFRGEVFVKDNNWNFFLGDKIWEPVDRACPIFLHFRNCSIFINSDLAK